MFVCLREDGTSTWMPTSSFFVVHDLAHYVVETRLGFASGFYGLVKDGMDITDFSNKQKISPRDLPDEAMFTEHAVNILLAELSDKRPVENFQDTVNEACSRMGRPSWTIAPEMLESIRLELRTLLERWKQLPENRTLELIF